MNSRKKEMEKQIEGISPSSSQRHSYDSQQDQDTGDLVIQYMDYDGQNPESDCDTEDLEHGVTERSIDYQQDIKNYLSPDFEQEVTELESSESEEDLSKTKSNSFPQADADEATKILDYHDGDSPAHEIQSETINYTNSDTIDNDSVEYNIPDDHLPDSSIRLSQFDEFEFLNQNIDLSLDRPGFKIDSKTNSVTDIDAPLDHTYSNTNNTADSLDRYYTSSVEDLNDSVDDVETSFDRYYTNNYNTINAEPNSEDLVATEEHLIAVENDSPETESNFEESKINATELDEKVAEEVDDKIELREVPSEDSPPSSSGSSSGSADDPTTELKSSPINPLSPISENTLFTPSDADPVPKIPTDISSVSNDPDATLDRYYTKKDSTIIAATSADELKPLEAPVKSAALEKAAESSTPANLTRMDSINSNSSMTFKSDSLVNIDYLLENRIKNQFKQVLHSSSNPDIVLGKSRISAKFDDTSSTMSSSSAPAIERNLKNITSRSDSQAVPKIIEPITAENNSAAILGSKSLPNLQRLNSEGNRRTRLSSYYIGHLEEDDKFEAEDVEIPNHVIQIERKNSFRTKVHQRKEELNQKYFSLMDDLENKPGSKRVRNLKLVVCGCCSLLLLLILGSISIAVLNLVIGPAVINAVGQAPTATISGSTYSWVLTATVKNNGGVPLTISLKDAVVTLNPKGNGPKPRLSSTFTNMKEIDAHSQQQISFTTSVDVTSSLTAICETQLTFGVLNLSFQSTGVLVLPDSFSSTFQLLCPSGGG
eukprot:NODE_357_length_10221_cov_0.563130.p1 type:complete len:769 gc:universal NODE_357_length_10221_cov_0.563130:6917-9223(+)